MLKERNVRTGFFEREQIERILAHLPLAIRPAVQFGYITGWRIPSEVRKLQWRHVDFEARVVPGPAHDEERRKSNVSVHRRASAVPKDSEGRARPTESRGHHLPRGVQPLKPEGERQAHHDVHQSVPGSVYEGGLPGRIPHDLRRTAVRNLVRAGVPERVAMHMTGHKTRSVFERYNHRERMRSR